MRARFKLKTEVNVVPPALRTKVHAGMYTGGALMWAFLLLQPLLPAWSQLLLVSSGVLTFAASAWFLRADARYQRVRVRVDGHHVHLGTHTIPRALVRSAYFAPAAGKGLAGVRLCGHADQVAYPVPSQAMVAVRRSPVTVMGPASTSKPGAFLVAHALATQSP
ncbi:MAG: hypothetical protein WKG00_10115 [Polyangiaceae bacterium]